MNLLIPMTFSPDLVDFVKGWESCRLKAYQDKNDGAMWTCGWGQTGPDIMAGTTWTQEYADSRLAATLRDVAVGLRSYLFRQPSQQQFDALGSLAYNEGYGKIGTSGLMSRFNEGLDTECALRFLLWNKETINGVLVPSEGLTKRREAEMKIYTDGDYSGRP